MTHTTARMLFLCLLLFLGFGLINGPIAGTPPKHPAPSIARDSGGNERIVWIAGGMTDENLIILTAAIAAAGDQSILLLDSPKATVANKLFLSSFRPSRVVPIGAFPEGMSDLESRLEMKLDPVMAWKQGAPVALWHELFPSAKRVVVSPAKPRRMLLQAACLAGTLHAPLVVTHGQEEDGQGLGERLRSWGTRHVYAVGEAIEDCRTLSHIQVQRLDEQSDVAALCLKYQRRRGPIETLVVTNPADSHKNQLAMSTLAPWVALHRHAGLLFTNAAGDNVRNVVETNLRDASLTHVENVIFVADLNAIPMEQRPNPVATGKDPSIEMEPLTPKGNEPFSFAMGRLFHEDPAIVALILARQCLLAEKSGPYSALVASNPGGGLPLLEAFSKNTAKELNNTGYNTTAFFGGDVNKDDLRRLLPEQDIFLWEGHYNTLVKEYGMQNWEEPMRPALVFLQSCLALSESKAQPFLQRGAVSVVGSSTRTYSASGGACSLAFFDALLYDNLSLGSSLRQAKNFLLAYSLLKEKRLGKDAKLTGANMRSAWAFTLWGDPTLKLPLSQSPTDALAHVQHRVEKNTLIVSLPKISHQASSSKYLANMLPNERLAGLVARQEDEGKQPLIPFVFVEVHLPRSNHGLVPQLHGRLPGSRWVFCWDPRRSCGYLLAEPRHDDREELRFHIRWECRETVQAK